MWSGQQGPPCPADPSVGAGKPIVIVASCWFGQVASAQPFRPSVYSRPCAAEASCGSGTMSSFVLTPTVCHEIFPEQCSHLSPLNAGTACRLVGPYDQQACSEHA